MAHSKNLIIIPTYNEVENILIIIDKILNLPVRFDVLVVDDNSPDGTAKVVSNHIEKNKSRINIEVRKEKQGLGKAYIHGFFWAIKNDYEYIFEMDADLSHDPKDLVGMYNCLKNSECDVIIGSRYINGINVVNWPLNRIILSYCASIYARVITGIPIKDSTSGFVGFRRNVLQKINLKNILFNGYAFQIELKFKAYKLSFKIKEIPIIFRDRIHGDSKMSGSIIFEAIFGLIKLKFLSFFKNYK
tara:strand:+ start:1034 stop:1768 length:735 start_codon:yes stop_codon:yes gene_type:complete